MPRGDRTGPMGMGVMTGRSAGYCAGSGMPGFANPLSGRGYQASFGRGRGIHWGGFSRGGRGWRNRFFDTWYPNWRSFGGHTAPYGYQVPYQKSDPELEKHFLKTQADALQSELQLINKRLADLETSSPEV
jgi:hypothetical protein